MFYLGGVVEWGRGNILQLQCGGRTGTSVRLGPCVRWLLTVVSLGGVRMRRGQAGTVDTVWTLGTRISFTGPRSGGARCPVAATLPALLTLALLTLRDYAICNTYNNLNTHSSTLNPVQSQPIED